MKSNISVIVPVFNVAPYLRECLDSILAQTYTAFELILVDDGSSDGSEKICELYKKKDQRIKVVHQTNQGLSSARNRGMSMALSEYLCFVDADDIIDPDYLMILYQNAEKYHADISWCGFIRFWETDDIHPQKENVVRQRTAVELWDLLTSVGPQCNSTEFVIACDKLIRTSKAQKVQFPEGRWHEDEFYVHRLLAVCDSFVESEAKLYYYRQRKGSISGSNNKLNVHHLDILDAFEERIKYCRQYANQAIYKKTISAYRFMIMVQYDLFSTSSLVLRFRIKRRFVHSLLVFWQDVRPRKRDFLFCVNAKAYYHRYWNRKYK